MAIKHFTHTDYYSASLTRYADLTHLRTNTNSAIFSVYTAGVTIECMFRAYITKYTKEFDSKHDLEKLYAKSLLGSEFDTNEKEQLTIAVKKANEIWTNDLRYASEKRMKRIIAHKNVKANLNDVNKYIERDFSAIFDATELIIEKGKVKWT
jgi:hypothetical protein